MRQLDVQIMGQSYLLGCPEGGEARLLDAAHQVDQAMCKIRDAGKVRARDRIAVLAALNLVFDMADALRQVNSAGTLTQAAALPSSPAPDRPDPPPAIDVQVHSLLTRLDAALSDDGRLI
jgi:cell division protein ZapA